MSKSIYLADDEVNIRNLVQTFLEREGYDVTCFPEGESLLRTFSQNPCDLVILDVMMPGKDGFTILSELRKISDVPIVMLTARDSDVDYISGLSMGSDDYFTKPFSPIKLVTKVKAIFRRIDMQKGASIWDNATLEFEDLFVSPRNKMATCHGKDLALTPNELSLITYLIMNKDRAVSRAELLDRIWGYETEVETRVADDTVKRLRKKLAATKVEIKTVWGFGFRLQPAKTADLEVNDDSH